MRRILAVFIGLLGFTVAMGAARAQVVCGDHREIVKRLASEFGEVRHSAGLVQNGRIIETFISPVTGSWTILMTHTGVISCVVASGGAGEIIHVRSPGPASPS